MNRLLAQLARHRTENARAARVQFRVDDHHALLSKRRYEPSLRRIALRVRTITALHTSPFFTWPSGAASLIAP